MNAHDTLVKYAGAERATLKNPPKRRAPMAVRADALFGLGKSTAQIAKIMKVTENRAHRLVNVGRSLRLGLPSPYLIRRGSPK